MQLPSRLRALGDNVETAAEPVTAPVAGVVRKPFRAWIGAGDIVVSTLAALRRPGELRRQLGALPGQASTAYDDLSERGGRVVDRLRYRHPEPTAAPAAPAPSAFDRARPAGEPSTPTSTPSPTAPPLARDTAARRTAAASAPVAAQPTTLTDVSAPPGAPSAASPRSRAAGTTRSATARTTAARTTAAKSTAASAQDGAEQKTTTKKAGPTRRTPPTSG